MNDAEVIDGLKQALRDIVDLHGAKDEPRHECALMANIARGALLKWGKQPKGGDAYARK